MIYRRTFIRYLTTNVTSFGKQFLLFYGIVKLKKMSLASFRRNSYVYSTVFQMFAISTKIAMVTYKLERFFVSYVNNVWNCKNYK